MRASIRIEGEVYVSIEEAARCYAITVEELIEVHELGLLGPSRVHEATTLLSIEVLERVARLRCLTRDFGLDLTAAVLLLD